MGFWNLRRGNFIFPRYPLTGAPLRIGEARFVSRFRSDTGLEGVVHIATGSAYSGFPASENVIVETRIRRPGSEFPDPELRRATFAP
jgi:hypothetical protein